MKRLFTFLALAFISTIAFANDYNGKLTVTVNGISSSQENMISVEKDANGKYTLSLKNFILKSNGSELGVGNIILPNIEGVKQGDAVIIKTTRDITIEKGDDPKILFWVGPNLGAVPVDLMAKVCDDRLYAVININMVALKQVIQVDFVTKGYGFQIGNSDFESFHVATVANPTNPSETKTSDEADNWHSFMSATIKGFEGNEIFGWMAINTPHTFIGSEVRPNSVGKNSLLVTSASVLGIMVANGTVSTGRINAGSIKADSTLNCSYSDMSLTDVDDNGDPFYAAINGCPDSLVVWVKFKQETPNETFPYATINAVVTDGTYYQDPQDKEYTNVLAKATNAKIESKGFVWQRLSIPFVYTDNASSLKAKNIHITISTNAAAGQGSGADSLFVDDMELVYNCGVSNISVKGVALPDFDENKQNYDVKIDQKNITADDVVVTTNGVGTIVEKQVKEDNGRSEITIDVYSNDWLKSKHYVITVDQTNKIDNIENRPEVKSIYNMEGLEVSDMLPGNVYIIKYNNGKTVKVTK